MLRALIEALFLDNLVGVTAEKLSRRMPRRLKEFFRLRRSYQGWKTYRFCAIHRVVGVTTTLSTQGFQEAFQSVYRIGFPKTDRPIFAHTREKLECLDSRRCFGDSWDKSKENIRICNRVLDNNKHNQPPSRLLSLRGENFRWADLVQEPERGEGDNYLRQHCTT
jgi:hypothetical protein